MRSKKAVIGLKVLPGEPTNGNGKICIHLLVVDSNGKFEEPSVTAFEEVEGVGKRLTTKAMKCRIACDANKLVAPITIKGVTHVTMRTNEPSAVTCPKCIASDDYKRMTEQAKSSNTNNPIGV